MVETSRTLMNNAICKLFGPAAVASVVITKTGNLQEDFVRRVSFLGLAAARAGFRRSPSTAPLGC